MKSDSTLQSSTSSQLYVRIIVVGPDMTSYVRTKSGEER